MQQGTLGVKDFAAPQHCLSMPLLSLHSIQNTSPIRRGLEDPPVCANVLTPANTFVKKSLRKLPDVLFVLWCFSALVSGDRFMIRSILKEHQATRLFLREQERSPPSGPWHRQVTHYHRGTQSADGHPNQLLPLSWGRLVSLRSGQSQQRS